MRYPLEGIRLLELANYMAGPLAGMVLADLGAEVIKIENPHGGDMTRHAELDKHVPNPAIQCRNCNILASLEWCSSSPSRMTIESRKVPGTTKPKKPMLPADV